MRKGDYLSVAGFLIMLPFVIFKLYLLAHVGGLGIVIPEEIKYEPLGVEPLDVTGLVEYWKQKAYRASIFTGIVSSALLLVLCFSYFKSINKRNVQSSK